MSTYLAVRDLAWFTIEMRQAQNKGLPGFEPENVAAILAEQAANVAGELKHPAALGLCMNLVKMTVGFRLAFEHGELGWLAQREKIDFLIAETAKHLGE